MSNIYDKASLVLIPSGTKTSKVYSQKPVNGDGDFTFSRSTAATRVNADGNIEKETQNLLTYSNTFSSWSPTRGTLVQGVSDPFGGNDAWSLTATDQDPYLYNQTAWSGVATLSIWAKGVGSSIGKPIQLRMGGSFEEFTLTGDWQRFEKFTNGSASNIGIEVPNPAVAGDVVHIYGAQLEYGLVARDYIETTTAAVEGGITDNVPRLDYTDSSCPALLLEPQRTNIVSQSEYMQYSNNTNVSVNDNETTSPEGVVNAAKAIPNATNSNHIVRSNNLAGLTSQGTYSVSVFAKQNGYKYIVVGAGFGSTATPLPTFDLNTGTIVSNSSNGTIEDYGNGWYKCTATIQIASTALYPIISILNNSQSGTYSGDGTSAVYLYGHQIEEGNYATSYIPTYGTSVTRNDDVANVTGVSDIIGQSEGTLFLDYVYGHNQSNPELFSISDGSVANRIYVGEIGNSFVALVRKDSISQFNPSGLTPVIGQRYKFALAYANNDFAFYVNGTQIATSSSGSVPSTSQIRTDSGAGSSKLYQNINNIMLFKTRLSNEELAALTTI